MSKYRLFVVALALVLAISSISPADAAGTPRGSVDPNSVVDIQTSALPRGVTNAAVDVVVRLTAQSVTEVQATLGRKTSDDEDKAIVSSLKKDQESLKGAIRIAGGEVSDQYQYAINGIRVRIAGDQAEKLSKLPNVLEVLPVQKYTVDNAISVPYIGAPAVWNDGPSTGLHGENIKIGIIDTGIDYTHANFGGPGTEAAYADAHALETSPANPALFGAAALKVKGGYDFVGDAYDANDPSSIPQPDSNPLDCNGHGSHVAGTSAGFGVTADGSTYNGPYNASIYTPGAFRIGPGVAPKADLYAYRVFGCDGSTNVVVEAIDRAVADGMDVINMSLGSAFGTARNADTVAVANATRAGVIVVTSAGNSGPNPYIVGSPSTADGAISVAASDPYQTFPGASLTLSSGGAAISAINANGAILTSGATYNIVTIGTNATTSLGCALTDYPASLPANTIAIVLRGTCARTHKAIIAQKAGAAAVVMVNNSTSLPPYEGPIISDPDTGEVYTVTIPFFGVRGLSTTASSDGARLRAANGATVTVTSANIPNPGFAAIASFSSGGPRIGDSNLKPEITAPGVSTFSTRVGSGNQGEFISGTSMAAPHVAGVAALVKQAHPNWKEEQLKAAIVSTSDPAQVAGYSARSAGAGLVQPYAAVMTNAFAAGGEHGVIALNFGYQELSQNLKQSGQVKISNRGAAAITFNVSVSNQGGVAHTLTPKKSTVTIQANEDTDLEVSLSVPAATAGDSSSFNDVSGIITLTPANGGNNGISLRVPYYLVPRPLSTLTATSSKGSKLTAAAPTTVIAVANKKGSPILGNADFYAWGLHSAPTPGQAANDVRDVGVQAFQNGAGPNNPIIVFGVNTYSRWSTPSENEFDIYVDVDPQNNNGDDYIVFGADYGAYTTGALSGQFGTFVYSLRSGSISSLNPANTFAPTNSSSAALLIIGSQLCRAGQPCLNAANPRFTYHVVSYDFLGTAVDVVPGVAAFNAYAPAISTGDYLSVAPGSSASVTLSINPAEWAQTPALGALLLTTENASGKGEALEVPLTLK